MTSMTWSGPTTPAVSSSTPRPSSDGFWAMRLSSRPSRLRCWKCWSTMTPGRTPEAGGDLGHPVLGRRRRSRRRRSCGWTSPRRPRCVPATTAPWRNCSRIASARRVPPIVEDRRSWLPPVMNMPVASRRARAAVSSLAWARVTAWIGRTLLHAELAEDLLVALAGLQPERRRGRDDGDGRVRGRRRARRSGSG